MHFVYIIYSQSADRYYCGETRDIQDRIQRHNAGRSKATKYGVPWKIIKIIETTDRAAARKIEKKIKGKSIKRFLSSG